MDETKIIVVGADGRMGKTLCNLLADKKGFKLVGALEKTEGLEKIKKLPCPVSSVLEELVASFPEAVIIDFTSPESSLHFAKTAASSGNAIVIGTTGFTASQKLELERLASETSILCSGNMSVGINVLIRFLPEIAKALGPEYEMEIMEIHHKHKKDAPSGTALMLGESLAKSRGWMLDDVRCSGRDGIIGERASEQIGIQALRGGDVAGVHTVYFLGEGERVELSHHAHSRENFANGALYAARWLQSQAPGRLYSMQDTFSI